MASCPPPPKKLEPPDIAPIDFLGGKYKLSGAVFYNTQTKKWNGSFYDQRPTTGSATGTTRDHRGTGQTWTKISSKEFRDPTVGAVLAWMEKWAKKAWKMVAGDVRMTDMLDQNRPHDWTIRYGDLRALEPLPGETVGHYRNRGGVPLVKNWLDGRRSIDRVLPSWVDKHNSEIEAFHLHIQWDGRIGRSMTLHTRIETPGRMDKVGDAIARAIRWACSKLTNDKLMSAAAAGAMLSPSPEMQAAIAAYMAVAALCNKAWPSCAQPGGGQVITPMQVSAVPVAPTYPQGAIAWFDKKLGQYRIAVPLALGGLVATHSETVTAPEVPNTVQVVNRLVWETATRPWYRRTAVQVAGAAIGLVAVGGTAYALARR